MGTQDNASQVIAGLLFPRIFRTFELARQPSKLIIAFAAIAAIFLAGWLLDLTRSVVTTPGTRGQETELQFYMTSPERLASYIDRYKDAGTRTGVFSTLWSFAVNKSHAALRELFTFNLPGVAYNAADYLQAVRWAIRYHPFYIVIFSIVKLAVISIAGGAICRIAALQFARNEKPGITEALRFSLNRFTRFFAAPLIPAAVIIFFGLLVFVLGLISNIPRIGELIAAILIVPALAAGAVIAVAAAGTIAGCNLMFPAIAYDGSDSLDAISRSFNYVFVRPWRLGFYTAVAAVYGAICYIVIRFFAFLLLWSTNRALRLGSFADSARGLSGKMSAIWPEPTFTRLHVYPAAAANWSESVAAFLIYLSTILIIGLVLSFVISFYFSASTIIYSLMRNKVDNTPLEDVYTETEEARAASVGATLSSQAKGD